MTAQSNNMKAIDPNKVKIYVEQSECQTRYQHNPIQWVAQCAHPLFDDCIEIVVSYSEVSNHLQADALGNVMHTVNYMDRGEWDTKDRPMPLMEYINNVLGTSDFNDMLTDIINKRDGRCINVSFDLKPM